MKPFMTLIVFGIVLWSGLSLFSACTKDEDENIVIIDDGLDASFDWRDSSIVTPAKQQGAYGTCGVFAAIGVFESAIALKTGELVDLSEQHFVNASTTWDASTGVNPMHVYDFIISNGIVLESRLPYVARISDEIPDGQADYYLSSYETINLEEYSADEARKTIKQVLYDHGPVATAMDIMSDLPAYGGGIYEPGKNSTSRGGHWVVIVGWKDDPDLNYGGYWIVKNSNGPNWGEHGFFRIPYSVCNLDRYVITYTNY